MKKIISLLTATRAEYGLLRPIIQKLNQISDFDVRIAVTGAHLSSEFGFTYKEIENDGFKIDKKIKILLNSDSAASISKSMGIAMSSFADYFDVLNPDLLIILGDRYETLAVAITAMNQRVPIAHLYGGETTEGALDESFRHAITKLSFLHFTSTENYRKRVIQLGEDPTRVFNVGAIGIENIKNEKLLNKEELMLNLNIDLNKPFAVVTFHPVTLESYRSLDQAVILLEVCKNYKEMNFIFTKANADNEGRTINKAIERYSMENSNIILFDSLGTKKYLSALKYCEMIIGNSSSGLIESTSFGIPAINIGDRQKGRLQGDNVINCLPTKTSIQDAINLASSTTFKITAKNANNPYGDGNTSNRIVDVLKEYLLNENRIELKKKFYDCEIK